jgi:nuclease S1
VHQPLHVSFGCDEGGNKVNVEFYGLKSVLHKVWDDLIINKWEPNYHTASTELQTMINNDPSLVAKYTASMDPSDWAQESFSDDLSTVYVFAKGQGDTHCCGTNTGKPGVLPRDSVVQIGAYYNDKNLPIIKQRLIAAGIRLGQLLNNIFVGNSTRV